MTNATDPAGDDARSVLRKWIDEAVVVASDDLAPDGPAATDASNEPRQQRAPAQKKTAGAARSAAGPSENDEHKGADQVDPDVLAACARLDTSDTDNSKRLLRHFGSDLAVLAMDGAAGGEYLAWAGTHWDLAGGEALAQETAKRVGDLIKLEAAYIPLTPQEDAAIQAAVAAGFTVADIEGFGDDLKDAPPIFRAAIKAYREWSGRAGKRVSFGVTSKNGDRIKKMLALAASSIRRRPSDWNPDRMKVATETHTLSFRFEPDPECPDPDVERLAATVVAEKGHRREDWITAVVPQPWKGVDADAPDWGAFLDRTLPDLSKRRTVQQVTGLGLLGVPLQKVMFHYGLGANGKSVFLETITRVLGPGLSVGLPRESIVGASERAAGAASPDLVRLYGKRMVRILEVPGEAPLQVDLIKRLTGGEAFPVRTLFKGYFEFQSFATPHMSGNGKPTIPDTDHGIWRRMLVVHWDQTLSEEEQRDFEEMVTELVEKDGPGILAWMVEGALDFLQNGLFVAECIRNDTAEYRVEMDPIGEFCDACVRIEAGPGVQANDLYQAYISWSEANAKRARTKTKFGREMAKRFQKEERTGRIFYQDIALENVPPRPEEPRTPY